MGSGIVLSSGPQGTGRTGTEEGGRAEQEQRRGDGQNRKDVRDVTGSPY